MDLLAHAHSFDAEKGPCFSFVWVLGSDALNIPVYWRVGGCNKIAVRKWREAENRGGGVSCTDTGRVRKSSLDSKETNCWRDANAVFFLGWLSVPKRFHWFPPKLQQNSDAENYKALSLSVSVRGWTSALIPPPSPVTVPWHFHRSYNSTIRPVLPTLTEGLIPASLT